MEVHEGARRYVDPASRRGGRMDLVGLVWTFCRSSVVGGSRSREALLDGARRRHGGARMEGGGVVRGGGVLLRPLVLVDTRGERRE